MKPLEEIIRALCSPIEPQPTDLRPRPEPLNNVRAVLFDVYGTLLISGSGDVGTAAATDTAEAMTSALAAAHYTGDLEHAGEAGREILQAEVMEWHVAARRAGTDYPEVDIVRIWERVVEKLRDRKLLEPAEIDIEPIRQLAVEYECRVNPVWPMPGCRELLKALKTQGIALGIVSNAQFYTPLIFSALFDMDLEQIGFDPECCIWSYRELRSKPSTELFPLAEKNLKRRHGISLSETVYVGNDMLNDVYTAKQAGCRAVLFAGDQRSLRLRSDDERCRGLEPDAVITALPQLLKML